MKNLILILLSSIILCGVTSAQSGTKVTSSLVPNSYLDNYSTHQAKFGKGGYRSVKNMTERDAIFTNRRDTGMLVYVASEDKIYILKGGIANSNWDELKLGSNASTDTVAYTKNGIDIFPGGYTYAFRVNGTNTNYSAFVNTFDNSGNPVDARFTKQNNSITVYPAINCKLDALIVLNSFSQGAGGKIVIDTFKYATVNSVADTAKNLLSKIITPTNGILSWNSTTKKYEKYSVFTTNTFYKYPLKSNSLSNYTDTIIWGGYLLANKFQTGVYDTLPSNQFLRYKNSFYNRGLKLDLDNTNFSSAGGGITTLVQPGSITFYTYDSTSMLTQIGTGGIWTNVVIQTSGNINAGGEISAQDINAEGNINAQGNISTRGNLSVPYGNISVSDTLGSDAGLFQETKNGNGIKGVTASTSTTKGGVYAQSTALAPGAYIYNSYSSGGDAAYIRSSKGIGCHVNNVTGNTANLLQLDLNSSTKAKVDYAGAITTVQYKLSALNTAPASATDTGTLGEIRITASYIYICTATNTWVRSALSTW